MIVVFMTNHVVELDLALIRYALLRFEAFKTLARRNYLDIDGHPLFGDVEELLNEIMLADVAKNSGGGEDASLEELVEELKRKSEERARLRWKTVMVMR
ncbi:hypothetical protein HU200_031034 [Digitaria exilis]|uniref:AAA+ ATPase At3g28540-like C-terminal domain-containing protein n=1 Tax=Digitaria exilis TaxID=1010633 RepID=A0A835BRY4_9POAL|nr:hypothetical protein HU200_031034 [Digitaria exilis]CAB3476044.1 unnamed protein product [Digitaria exilis]